MKKTFLSLIIFAGLGFSSTAQTKAVLTDKISVPTVQCWMCKSRIESYVKKYDGILSIVVNVKKKEASVKYLTDRTNIEAIKTMIANAGYDAGDITANEDSYKALPKCCKKPEDGGGKDHPKQEF
jgi:copper chaperone CopZ